MFFISMEAIRTSPLGGSKEWGARPGQPLTAPLVRPATMRRWKMSTRTTTGMVTITAAAAMAPVGSWNWEAPENRPSAAGTGRGRLGGRTEEYTAETQLRQYIVCRLLI